MRLLLITVLIGLSLASCKKEKNYLAFNEKQLAFVNYPKGQTLKFMDSSMVLHTIQQFEFRREFREQFGLYGATGAFNEEYEVLYGGANNEDVGFYISMSAGLMPVLNIRFGHYVAFSNPDSLNPVYSSLTINGRQYVDVYALKMYRNAQSVNNNDTATLFHNRQSGAIQLLFPDGKSIVRVE